MNKFLRHILIFISGALIIFSCSRKKDRFINRNWHALNTKYNVLFNGGVAYETGLNDIGSEYDDNFWKILPIEPINFRDLSFEDDEQNSDLQRAEEKAIKAVQTHGMNIKGKEKNPQINEAYMLLGKARYYDGRFIPAIEAFNYVLFKYPGSTNINTAKLWKAKTNLRLENEAIALENLNSLLQQNDLNNNDRLEAHTTLAHLHINQGEIDLAITSIEKAINLTKNKEQKGRLLYIQGQLYNLKNFPEMANKSFQKVIDLKRSISRKYRVNAFLEQIKNFNYNSGNLVDLQEFLELLEKDRENRPFLDRIYHFMANHYMKVNKDTLAIEYYNKSLSTNSSDKYLEAINFHTLADFYYDKADYILAGAYYDSTLTKYSKKNKSYRLVKNRVENLKDVIYYENIAKENDSIINLFNMTDDELVDFFQPYIKNLNSPKNKISKRNLVDVKSSSIERRKSSKLGGFYFYQTETVAYGKNKFINYWGDRGLVDNWRWSTKEKSKVNNKNPLSLKDRDSDNPLTPKFYIDQIPVKQTQKDSIIKKRNIAYYKLGLIYKNKFKDFLRSINKLEFLLSQDLEKRLILPVKYNLYKAYIANNNIAQANKIKVDIINKNPNSQYAKILENPGVVLSNAENTPNERYEFLYNIFLEGKYSNVIDGCEQEILSLEGEDILPKFELLKALATARLYGIKSFEKRLNHLSLNYPNSDEGKEAQRLLNDLIPVMNNSNFFNFSEGSSFKTIFLFSSYDLDLINEFKSTLNGLINKESILELTISEDIYDINTTFVVIHGLKSINGALGFVELLDLKNSEILSKSYFAISSANYKKLQIHKNLEMYLEKINNKK